MLLKAHTKYFMEFGDYMNFQISLFNQNHLVDEKGVDPDNLILKSYAYSVLTRLKMVIQKTKHLHPLAVHLLLLLFVFMLTPAWSF